MRFLVILVLIIIFVSLASFDGFNIAIIRLRIQNLSGYWGGVWDRARTSVTRCVNVLCALMERLFPGGL